MKPALWGYLALQVVAFVCVTGFSAPRLVDRPVAPTEWASVGTLRQRHAAQQAPPVSATSYLVYDLAAQQLLLSQQIDQALPPASLTKLMTALLILEQDQLERTVSITAADLIGEASMGLRAGEQVTVEQLLWGLLIPSGNDAAMALARTSAGSVEQFVEHMNERAEALDLEQTRFANPHGLDAANHTSSAQDLLQLTRLLWQDPRFRTMVGTANITIAGHPLQNTNELLTTLPGTIGIKTGTTTAAGECLIALVNHADRQLLVVILGSRQRYADLHTLLAAYDTNFRWVSLAATELSLLNRVDLADGTRWYLRTNGAAPTYLLAPWQAGQVRVFRRIQLPPVGVSWQAGLEVGVLEWRLGKRVLGQQTLVLW